MKYAVSVMLSASLALGSLPTTAYGQSADEGSESGESTSKQRKARVEELAANGADAYRKGQYAKAIDLLKQAYALQQVPNLLYNIAKSYEKQDKPNQAKAYYQKFVVAPDVNSEARQAALDRIDALQAQTAANAGPKPAAKGANTGPDTPGPTTPTDEPTEASNAAGWWTLGTSAVLLAGGATAGALAASDADAVSDGTTFADRQSARDSGRTLALVADGLFVAGAAVAGIAIYLLVSDDGPEANPTAARTVVAPWVGRSSAGLGMNLDF